MYLSPLSLILDMYLPRLLFELRCYFLRFQGSSLLIFYYSQLVMLFHSNVPPESSLFQETAYFGSQSATHVAFLWVKILQLRFPKRY